MTRLKTTTILAVLAIALLAGSVQPQKAQTQKPITEIAGPDYKRPVWCSEAPPNTDCLVGTGSSIGAYTIGSDEIRMANGRTKYVITCDDGTNKPKPCWTPPPPAVPHPETLSECLLRRYQTYEKTWNAYLFPPCPTCKGLQISRSFSEQDKQEFIRTMAALDESGKDECKGKPVQ
jgi:hypothetical protein